MISRRALIAVLGALLLATSLAFLVPASSSGIVTISNGSRSVVQSGGGDNAALDADFLARSTAPGVIKVYNFDADLHGRYFPGDNGVRGFHDTTQKVGSGGSLRFDLLAGEDGANISGSWTTIASPWTFGQGFGEGTTFYVQMRARITQSMLDNLDEWDSGWKLFIIHRNNNTAAGLEITHTQTEGSTLYTDSGGRGLSTELDSPFHLGGPDPQLWQSKWNIDAGGPPWTKEPGGYESEYPNQSNKWVHRPNGWMTFYVKVQIGTFTESGTVEDSPIQMWIVNPDEDVYRKVIGCIYGLAWNTNHLDEFNNITLTPYMTGLSVGASQNASVWFDQLIISTQPIAAPIHVPE